MKCTPRLPGVFGGESALQPGRATVTPDYPLLCARLTFEILLVVLVFVLSGCFGPKKALRIGANIWPGYEPMYLARSLGYYDGQPIQLVEFSSSTEVLRAYRNHLIDVAALTGDEALNAADGDSNNRIVFVCDFSNGADVILAKPKFRSVQDLKGRRVGVETTGLGAYMLSRALEQSGLSVADITIVYVPLSENEEAYTEGRVDAVVTFEPIRSRLLERGARKLFDSSMIPGEIVDVFITHRDLEESQNRALGSLVNGWLRALDYLKNNPDDAATRIAHRQGTTPQQSLEAFKGIIMADRETNRRLLGISGDNLSPVLRRLAVFMGNGKTTASTKELPHLDDTFVR